MDSEKVELLRISVGREKYEGVDGRGELGVEDRGRVWGPGISGGEEVHAEG